MALSLAFYKEDGKNSTWKLHTEEIVITSAR